MEVMYSVGVMLVIFIIMTGISFNRQLEIQDRSDYITKRDECYRFADYITSVATGGNGTYVDLYARHEIEILEPGVLVVGKEDGADSVTATCTIIANITGTALSHLTRYRISNTGTNVNITELG